MAETDLSVGPLEGGREAASGYLARLARWTVGDRTGGALFLGSMLVYALGWQAGITILDTYAVANGFVAVVAGHLHVETVAFGPGLETPGMHYVDGQYYARNYGQIVAAMPIYWLLEGLDAVTELRVAIAGLWSLCLVAFASMVATLRDDRRILVAGTLTALGVFLLNLWAPTPVPEGTKPLLALQLLATGAAGLSVVTTYRLLSRVRSQRTGVLGATLVAVGTPVAFWASIPKRHTLTTAVVLVLAYLLFRSRTVERAAPWESTTLRAGMYALVGLFAWVHAPLAVTLFLPLVSIDIATAPSNTPRELTVIAGAFALSLVPFLLTNYLISGNPVQPPRLLPAADSVPTSSGTGGVASGSGAENTGRGASPLLGAIQTTLAAIEPVLDRVLGVYWHGLVTVLGDPGRLYRVVLFSTGEVPKTPPDSVQRASNLSMLEATPLLGAALALPAGVVASRIRRSRRSPNGSNSQGDGTVSTDGGSPGSGRAATSAFARLRRVAGARLEPTDAFLLSVSVLVALVYLPRLPIQGQITMRYLTPLYPVAVYALCRHRRLGDRIVAERRVVAYAYEATVLVGVPAAVATVMWFELGEMATFNLLAGTGVTVGIALCLVTAFVLVTDRGERAMAGLFGAAAGTTTGFVLLSQLVLFHYGVHLLPVVQACTETVRHILVQMTV